MAIKQVTVYECDLCFKEYKPYSINEYSGEFVTGIRIDGWYKPEKQAIKRCICTACSSKILKLILEIQDAARAE